MKNTTKQPLKGKWTGPIDNSGKSHLAYMNKMSQHKRFWYLLHWQAAKDLTSLHMDTVLPEPLLLTNTR